MKHNYLLRLFLVMVIIGFCIFYVHENIQAGQGGKLNVVISTSSSYFKPKYCNQENSVEITILVTSNGLPVEDAYVSQTRPDECDVVAGRTDRNGVFKTTCVVPNCDEYCYKATKTRRCPCIKFGLNYFWQVSKDGFESTGEIAPRDYLTLDCRSAQ
jgi:hypothetical protein